MIEKIKYYYYFYLYFIFRYFSFQKVLNAGLALVEYWLKKPVMNARPFIASIDPANFCPLHCPLCPTGRGDRGVKKKILGFKDFKKYFDTLKDYLFFIRFYNWGEPLLAKDIFRMIKCAHQNHVGVVVNSNLNYITGGLPEKIVTSGLDYLEVSIDGIKQSSYEKYRVGGNLKKVFQVVRRIVKLKKKYQSKVPILHWSFLLNKYNQKEAPQAKKIAKKLGFDFITFFPLSLITKVNEKATTKAKAEWLGPSLTSQKGETEPQLSCYFLWTSFNVSPNGLVFPCCGIYEDRYAFGDLNKQTLDEIWNNAKFQSARQLFKKGVKPRANTVCQICDWFKKVN